MTAIILLINKDIYEFSDDTTKFIIYRYFSYVMLAKENKTYTCSKA